MHRIAKGFLDGLTRAVQRIPRIERLKIGPRLIACFVLIILSMLGSNTLVLWQFHRARSQAKSLNGINQKLVVVMRVHTSLLAFHDRLNQLAESEDAARLAEEGSPLRSAVSAEAQRATDAFSRLPTELQGDPTNLLTLESIRKALPAQLDAITALAKSGDWNAVRRRLANQVGPLQTLTSTLVEKVEHEVSEEQAQIAQSAQRVEQQVFLMVPITALFTLLVAGVLGLAITRSITQPLERLVQGSTALATGEFEHQVVISGEDELARLGRVFNETADRLRDLYATLQSSEDRLRLAIDTIPAHVWSTHPDGSLDFINQRWLESTGLSSKDALGWAWQSVVHPADRQRFLAEWRTALETGQLIETEVRLRQADGQYRWWLIRNVPLRTKSGKIVKWYGTSVDIEERKLAEEKLRRSEAYLVEAQRLTHTGSWTINVGTDEHFWSEEMFRIHEFDPNLKPTWSLILDRVHPDDRASLEQRKKMEFTQTGWADSEADLRIVLPDGRIKHLHTIAHPVMDASGKIVEVIGTTMDVTEPKRIEDCLRRSESHLAEAQKLTHTGSWAWRVSDRSAVHLSDEWYRIYEFNPDKGAPGWEEQLARVHTEDRLMWKGTIEGAIMEKTDYDVEFRIVVPRGAVKWIRTVGHPVLSDGGDLMQFVGSSTDITERKSAEQEREKLRQLEADLAHMNRVSMLGEMAASLAHEIKQPIAAAITSANTCMEWLEHEPPNLDRARAAATRIDKYGNRAAQIVDHIRSFYKKSSSQRELVDVNGIVYDILTLLKDEAIRCSVTMRTELAAALPEIMADRVQLQQVFMNLMLNGIEAMAESGGELTVRSQQQDSQLLFSVSDTGVGLPTDKGDQIFSAFFTTKTQGSGMGLAISRSIVESYGGRLWASANDGRGATFHFSLPIATHIVQETATET